MNYYERHIGDYAKDAGHLSMLEHGAYTLLLDRYYATEQPIPVDQVYRIGRAKTRDEKAAVDAVLAEFFVLNDGAWRNGRTEEEIEKANRKIGAARTNGAKGGRPKKNLTTTDEKPTGFSLGSENETQPKAHQTPDTRLLTPADAGVSAEPPAYPPCPHAEVMALFGKNLPELPQPRPDLWAGTRAEHLRARWRWLFATGKAKSTQEALGWFDRFFGYVATSDFLTGRNGKWTGCDLGWLVEAKNFAKVIEGKYDSERVAA